MATTVQDTNKHTSTPITSLCSAIQILWNSASLSSTCTLSLLVMSTTVWFQLGVDISVNVLWQIGKSQRPSFTLTFVPVSCAFYHHLQLLKLTFGNTNVSMYIYSIVIKSDRVSKERKTSYKTVNFSVLVWMEQQAIFSNFHLKYTNNKLLPPQNWMPCRIAVPSWLAGCEGLPVEVPAACFALPLGVGELSWHLVPSALRSSVREEVIVIPLGHQVRQDL